MNAIQEVWSDARQGDLFATFLLLLALVILSLSICTGIYFFDSSFLKQVEIKSVVVKKEFIGARLQTQVNAVGNSTMVSQTSIPASWIAHVEGDEGILACDITHAQYKQIQSGEKVVGIITTGRLSGTAYCIGIHVN